MSLLDVEKMLADLSPEEPCGADLEYDPVFVEMTLAAQGKPEQQMGESTIEAEPPQWGAVKKHALALWERTRDLRVALHLTEAMLCTDGFVGLSDALAVVQGLLERHWDRVHPILDPEDDNDPTFRVNIIASLCSEERMLSSVQQAVLVDARGLGRFSLRDTQIASGQIAAPEGEDPPEMSIIDAAFMQSDLEELQAISNAVGRCVECVQAIETTLTEKVGTSQAVDLSAYPKALQSVKQVLADQLARRGIEQPGGDPDGDGAPGVAAAGEIRSRDDVVRVLEKACEYFRQNEPSSPVPLLLQRAKRLVSKNFMEIMHDMAPEGVKQAETVSGVQDDN